MINPNRNNRTKDQHFVPQMHLKHFRGERPKNMIWTFDLDKKTIRPSKIQETGFQKNFYSIMGVDGQYIDDLDQLLTKIEGIAAAPYELMLSGIIPEAQLKLDFAQFIAIQYCRSPSIIKAGADGFARFAYTMLQMRAPNKVSFERLMDEMESDTGDIVRDRERLWEFMNDKDRFGIKVSHKKGLSILGASDEITKILFNRRWYIFEATEGTLITSDSPVVRFTAAEFLDKNSGDGGFANRNCEVSFPLTPKKLLIIADAELPSGHYPLPTSQIEFENSLRASHADRFLYSSEKIENTTGLNIADLSANRRKYRFGGMADEIDVSVTR